MNLAYRAFRLCAMRGRTIQLGADGSREPTASSNLPIARTSLEGSLFADMRRCGGGGQNSSFGRHLLSRAVEFLIFFTAMKCAAGTPASVVSRKYLYM